MLAASWMFRVRSCMIQIIQVGFSIWEFLSPYKSLLKLVYPCMFIKDIVMPWTWNDANISRRGRPCLWKRNCIILGPSPLLFLSMIWTLELIIHEVCWGRALDFLNDRDLERLERPGQPSTVWNWTRESAGFSTWDGIIKFIYTN